MECVEDKKNVNRKKMVFLKKQVLISLIILGIAAFLMVSPQLYRHSIILGNDSMFHFNRYYETYMQIKTGNFNFFQTIFGFDQSGRIVNALYGPDFAYIQGLLMFVTKNWFRYQLLSSFLCFFISGLAMFTLTRKLKMRIELSIFVSVLYMSSSMISYYALSQNMTSWGAAFAPFIYIPVVRVIKDKNQPIKPLELTLAVTSLGFLHNLTLFIGILSSSPFYIVGFFQTKFKKRMLLNFTQAVLLTILLNINTLIGFVEAYLTNNLVSPWLFEDMFAKTVYFTLGDNEWGALGLIFSCIMLFQIFYLFSTWGKTSILERLFTIIGAFFLVISSKILPWQDISEHFEFFQVIQFPRRFAVVAYIFLLISFAITLEKITKDFKKDKRNIMTSCLFVVSFLMVFNVTMDVSDRAEAWHSDDPVSAGNNERWLLKEDPEQIRAGFTSGNYKDAFKIISKATPDYLPIPKNMTQEELVEQSGYQMYDKQIIHNKLGAEKSIDSQNRLVVRWNGNVQDEEVTVPVIAYSRSQIYFDGETYQGDQIKKSNIGAPIVKQKEGTNQFIIGYKPMFNTTLVFIVKFITIVAIAVSFLVNKIRCLGKVKLYEEK